MKKAIIYNLLIINFLVVGLKAELSAQSSFALDSTFQPFFDMSHPIDGGYIGSIWENPNNGNLHLAGDFKLWLGNDPHYSIVSTRRDGSRNYDYKGFIVNGMSFFYPVNDSVFISGSGGGGDYFPMDIDGNLVWTDWRANYRKTVSCSRAAWPYFFPNGSSLMTNGWNGNPRGCMIINPPDTFPGQYIVKVDSLGLFDSTFQHTTNGTVTGFWPYDSTRLLVFGLPRLFTQYDGHTVNGLCRIYLDGTLDTTFNSPIVPGNGGFRPNMVEEDGKFFIIGTFQVVDQPNEWFSMLKLNADGSLDTTFNNLGRPIDTNYIDAATVGQVLRMPDNGYLVGGYFQQVQGYPKNGLVKLDSAGNIEPQFFTSRGPDSTHFFKTQGYVTKILKSKFGGYYAIGDWTYWDGVPTQPIVRLHELSVGLENQQLSPTLLNVYPNPVQDQLHLTYTPNSRITLIQLVDLQGKVVLTKNRQVNSISVSHLKNGIYFLKVIGENGVSTEKVVVSN